MKWPTIIALALLTNPGGIIGTVAPTFVNAFVAAGMSLPDAARMAAAEFFAMAIMLLFAPLLVRGVDRRLMATISLGAAVLGQFLSLSTAAPTIVLLCRTMAGAGEGALFAVAIASLSAAPSPDRAFGIAILSNQVAGTILLALTALLTTMFPAQVAILIAGTFIAAHVVLIPALPGKLPVQTARDPISHKRQFPDLIPVLCGLGGMFLLSAGFGAVWPLIGQIGLADGFSPATLATTFSVVGLGGIAGGFAAATIGARFGRHVPLIAGPASMALCLAATSTPAFVIAAIFVMFFWAFSLPYFLALLADIDRTGGLAVLTSAMIPFGIAAGQVIAGPLLDPFGVAGVARAGSLAPIAALCLALAGLRALRRSPVQAG